MCTTQTKVPSESGDDGDIWADSSDDGHHGADHRELGREAAARHQQFYNAGYRDGLEEGKEMRLQEGFNAGFKEGVAAGFEWGLLRGAVKTLAALDGQAAGTRGLHPQIQALQAAAEVPPREAMLAIFRQVLSAAPPAPQHDLGQTQRQTQPQHPPQDSQPQPSVHPAAPLEPRQQSSPVASCPERSTATSPPGPSADGQTSSSDPGVSACSCGTAGPAVGAAGQLADTLTALAVSTVEAAHGSSGGPAPAADGARGAGEAPRGGVGVPDASLPPGARVLQLPDMARVMHGLRGGLAGMGFEVGSAPVPRAEATSDLEPQLQLAAAEEA